MRKVSSVDGTLTTFAGTGDDRFGGDGGPAAESRLNDPAGVAVDERRDVYIADRGNHRVRKVSAADGTIMTIAGTGESGSSGDGGPATQAQLDTPTGVEVDARGNVYLADQSNYRVRKVTPDGAITTIAGTGKEASE